MFGKIALLVLVCVTLAVAQVIPGQYIVILNEDADLYDHMSHVNKSLGSGDAILHIYTQAILGYAGTFSDKTIAHIKSQKGVNYVEEDQMAFSSYVTQSDAPWGLARISLNRSLASGSVPSSYYYPSSPGSGVYVYVIDTGILTNHVDFGGRALWGYNAVGDGKNTDCNGHGTHVASSAVGTKYGVAKAATTVAVKVLGCTGSGTNAGVIAGINWVATNRKSKCVANLSLGGGISSAVDTAITNLIAAGCITVVAAGNDNKDACLSSPARVPAAITVGATASNDVRSTFSNWGTCVDIFAPGTGIAAAWYTSTTAFNTISGTSMASPHVAGIAAVQLGLLGSTGTTAINAVLSTLKTKATANVISNAGTGSPNLLAFSPYQ